MTATSNKKDISQSRIVIIGGSSGIGFATAKMAVKTGAEVIIASANADKVARAVAEIEGNIKGYTLDVADEANVAAFFKSIGNFDHLVYTAGENIKLGLLADADITESKDYFTIRYWGALACAKHAAPFITGSITFTGGVAANRPGAAWWLGSSICSAMEGLTRSLSIELAPLRVTWFRRVWCKRHYGTH